MAYGYELILDLVNCNGVKFSRTSINEFLIMLCEKIDMKREDLHFWDYQDCSEADYEKAKKNPHTFGCSAVQFILTSSIVIHTLPLLDNRMFINIFSCKEFNSLVAKEFVSDWFGGNVEKFNYIIRGESCPSTQ